ncbi:response regulator transcription factor [Clostridium cylindrosporum]|uniref:Stage 0 sporulation protein A homolog n=1 Tax=Clostridium cylindrosporum DSM 605 TaxID=1121307 RepID=A0A0J8D9E8_CLOCY|nr:response regulator transcription factor [Clostridium cylindrosporum]KMT20949.1 regulatory protein VanR [Clostridium cylindrosporum DSM 605]
MENYILVVEDNKEIALAIKDYLEKNSVSVLWASTGLEGMEEFNKNRSKIELAIIDIMLPEMDGFELCKNIRLKSDIPIIILSARFEEKDKVKGFEIGADDYLTKPFSLVELKARIDSQIRRYKRYIGEKEKYDYIEYNGGLIIYPEVREVRVDGKYVSLTSKEYDLLLLFCKNPSRIFTKKEFYESVWGEADVYGNNTVSVHIKSLREKIMDDLKNPKYIKTIWGSGYTFIGEKKS